MVKVNNQKLTVLRNQEAEIARLQGELKAARAEVERLYKQRIRCENCGGMWLDDGINSGCYCARIATLEAFVRADDLWHALDEADYGPECDRATARAAVGDLPGEVPNE